MMPQLVPYEWKEKKPVLLRTEEVSETSHIKRAGNVQPQGFKVSQGALFLEDAKLGVRQINHFFVSYILKNLRHKRTM